MSGSIRDIDHGWKDIKKELKKFKRSFVKVGVLEDAGEAGNGVTLAEVAGYNEFGTSTIPSRPFMAQTYDKNHKEVDQYIDRFVKMIESGRMTAEEALNKLGVWYTKKVRQTFVTGQFEPNAPSTAARKAAKGKNNDQSRVKNAKFKAGVVGVRPLIDTGHLRQQIHHQTVMDGEGGE